jgi:hypothetical protein
VCFLITSKADGITPQWLLQDVIDLSREIATDTVLEGGGGVQDFRGSGSGRSKAVSSADASNAAAWHQL